MSPASRTLVASPAARDEAVLVDGLRARLPESWAELYTTYYERLWRYAYARVGSLEEAEDIASQVFLRALSKIDSYRSAGKPIVAWLYGITRNVLQELYRNPDRKRTKQAETGGMLLMRPAAGDDGDMAQRLDLRSALEVLTPRQREVVTLLHLGGFEVREVAAMLGKGQRSVYYLEARALMRLKDELLAQEESV